MAEWKAVVLSSNTKKGLKNKGRPAFSKDLLRGIFIKEVTKTTESP